MSRIIETGRTSEGFPIYSYAPEPPSVPARFRIVDMHGVAALKCDQDGCEWDERFAYRGEALTEIVALAVEHAAEAHR